MSKKIIAIVLALPLSFMITAGVWALDQRYVTQVALQDMQQQEYIRELGDRIDELTLKESLGLASDYEKAILKQLKEKLDRAQGAQ